MAIQLPSGGLSGFAPFTDDNHIQLNPAFGGPAQRVLRAGSRWAAQVDVSPKTSIEAMAWSVILERGQTFLLDIPQPDLAIAAEGTPRINGASQTGDAVEIDGLPAGYYLYVGQWISIVIDGQRYAYNLRATSQANGSGEITAYLNPALRVSPGNNDVVEIEAPKMEGFIDLPESAFRMDVAAIMRGISFTIRERR